MAALDGHVARGKGGGARCAEGGVFLYRPGNYVADLSRWHDWTSEKGSRTRRKGSGCRTRESVGRKRLGFGQQGGGDTGLRGDSCRPALLELASPGDEKEKSGRRAARTDASPVHDFSILAGVAEP